MSFSTEKVVLAQVNSRSTNRRKGKESDDDVRGATEADIPCFEERQGDLRRKIRDWPRSLRGPSPFGQTQVKRRAKSSMR